MTRIAPRWYMISYFIGLSLLVSIMSWHLTAITKELLYLRRKKSIEPLAYREMWRNGSRMIVPEIGMQCGGLTLSSLKTKTYVEN